MYLPTFVFLCSLPILYSNTLSIHKQRWEPCAWEHLSLLIQEVYSLAQIEELKHTRYVEENIYCLFLHSIKDTWKHINTLKALGLFQTIVSVTLKEVKMGKK